MHYCVLVHVKNRLAASRGKEGKEGRQVVIRYSSVVPCRLWYIRPQAPMPRAVLLLFSTLYVIHNLPPRHHLAITSPSPRHFPLLNFPSSIHHLTIVFLWIYHHPALYRSWFLIGNEFFEKSLKQYVVGVLRGTYHLWYLTFGFFYQYLAPSIRRWQRTDEHGTGGSGGNASPRLRFLFQLFLAHRVLR